MSEVSFFISRYQDLKKILFSSHGGKISVDNPKYQAVPPCHKMVKKREENSTVPFIKHVEGKPYQMSEWLIA